MMPRRLVRLSMAGLALALPLAQLADAAAGLHGGCPGLLAASFACAPGILPDTPHRPPLPL